MVYSAREKNLTTQNEAARRQNDRKTRALQSVCEFKAAFVLIFPRSDFGGRCDLTLLYYLSNTAIMRTGPNASSHRWFDFFQVNISEARTMQETEFICRWAPLPGFRNVVDLFCGMGRHARALSRRGYSLVGIDRDVDVITKLAR